MPSTGYLKRRNNTWYVRVHIPRELWRAAGKREFIKALGTADLAEANRLKHYHVAEFNRRIAELARHSGDPRRAIFEAALNLHDAVERNKGRYMGPPGHEEPAEEFFIGEAMEQAQEIVERHGPEAADRFMRVVRGEATNVRDMMEQWLAETAHKPKRRDMLRADICEFATWAGESVTVEETDRRKAGDYIAHLCTRGLAAATVDRKRSALSSLWQWLGERGYTSRDPHANPWQGHGSIKKARTVKPKGERKGLTDAELLALLNGPTGHGSKYTTAIADMLRLALVTGARQEELCSLRKSEVEKRKDGYWINIREGKTTNAPRLIPLHKAANGLLARRLRVPGEFIIGELTAGAYGKRGHEFSKAYGRYRRHCGVAERFKDFHSLRDTFIETMEGSGVPFTTIQLIVGHSRKANLGTTADYTKGERVNLRAAVTKLRFSKPVMRLIEAHGS